MKKLFKTFFTTIIALNCLSVSAKDLRFIQLTDVHYNGSDRTQNYLNETISDINNLKGIEFVVFTGDNIDEADPATLKRFVKTVNKLNKPYYITVGNHDVFRSRQLSKEEYAKIIRRNSTSFHPRKMNYVFKRNGIVFIVMDGAKEVIPGAAGYFKQDELKWLEKRLKKYHNKKVVILQHFPLVPPREERTHRTYNTEPYLELLKKYPNVIAIFSGHYHQNGEKLVDGIYHVSSPTLQLPPYQYKIVDIKTRKNPLSKKKDYEIYTQLRSVQ